MNAFLTIYDHRRLPISSARVVWTGEPFVIGPIDPEPEIHGFCVMVNEPLKPLELCRNGKRFLLIDGRDFWELRVIALHGPAGVMLEGTNPIIIPKERSDS